MQSSAKRLPPPTPASPPVPPSAQSPSPAAPFTPEATADGSFTFFSPEFNEAFHSRQGARLEAELKFVKPTRLAQLAQRPTLYLLDVCYGLGYNTAAALATIWHINPRCQVRWYGLDYDVTVPQTAIAHHLLDQWPEPIPQYLADLAQNLGSDSGSESFESETRYTRHTQVNPPAFSGHLLIGDARQTIRQVIDAGFQADAIFLDPFSPLSCPQLWTLEFLADVVACLAPSGRLATYSCSAAVRTALIEAGLTIGSTPGVGRKSPGTVASHTGTDIPPLIPKEQEHLQTRSAIPFRDPTRTDNADTIAQRRRQEQALSPYETTSQWKKRWRSRGQ